MTEITLTLAVSLIVAFTEMLKRVFNIPSKYIPLISIAFASALLWKLEYSVRINIVNGLVAGFTACGLWSSGKTIKESIVNKK